VRSEGEEGNNNTHKKQDERRREGEENDYVAMTGESKMHCSGTRIY